jgi:ubiquitin carboxyl-terminal hydrolase 4/11/15
MLAFLTREEELSGDCQYSCPRCSKKQDAVRKARLDWPPPKILVLAINRVRWSERGQTKINSSIKFPMKRFNLAPFSVVQDQEKVEEEKTTTKKLNEEEDQKKAKTKAKTKSKREMKKAGTSKGKEREKEEEEEEDQGGSEYDYELTAVVVHYGSQVGSGHYTASCVREETGEWFDFNDSKVTPSTPEDVADQQPYILFYQRKDTPPSKWTK